MVSTQSELAQGGNGENLPSPKRADLHCFSMLFHAKWEGLLLICHDCPIKIGILMFYCQADTKRAVPSDRNMRPATLLFELGIFSHSKLGWVRIGIFRHLEPAWARHFMGDGTAPWSMWMTHGAGNHWILGPSLHWRPLRRICQGWMSSVTRSHFPSFSATSRGL